MGYSKTKTKSNGVKTVTKTYNSDTFSLQKVKEKSAVGKYVSKETQQKPTGEHFIKERVNTPQKKSTISTITSADGSKVEQSNVKNKGAGSGRTTLKVNGESPLSIVKQYSKVSSSIKKTR